MEVIPPKNCGALSFMHEIFNAGTDKPTVRSHFRAIRKEISEDRKSSLDSALVSIISELPEFISADTLLMYYPVRNEPNILSLTKIALSLGKRVAFPISHTESHTLTFHCIGDLSDLNIGAYGIPEPDHSLPMITEFSCSICIVPGMSFDKSRHRLGYGGGYYDRFLAEYDGYSIGATYSLLLADELPTDEYDLAVDKVITEEGVVN